jgi:glycerate 2-kinase
MRVVIAPDSFGGTLSAVEAADAIAAGWAATAPADDLDRAPMSDGGPGFVDVLDASLGGERVRLTVADPLGRPTAAAYLRVEETAYVESAQACGLHLLRREERDPVRATSRGVGELLAHAIDGGAARIVVGLGGSATNDGGAGALAALGGPKAAGERLAGVDLVAATDVDNPLLGIAGATAVYGPQKGASREQVMELEARMERWAGELAEATGREVRDEPGAGAAGGLGAALLALGGRRESGLGLVVGALGLAERISAARLVITGEGSFDAQSLRGKVAHGVAMLAQDAGVPCVVVAGRVDVGRREMAAAGVEAAYDLVGAVGERAALQRAGAALRDLAARVAREWSRAR